MKKFLVAVAFGLMAIAAQAEATFDQIQGLIEQRQYQAAEKGLEVIIQNHPKSAKAFYAMAQAQAGLGNLEKAQKALDIATGLNPTLDFAPASSVASLKEAITPQVKKIEVIETSHFWRNLGYFALFCGFGVAVYFLFSVHMRKREEEEAAEKAEREATEARYAKQREDARQAREALDKAEAERQAKVEAAEAALKAHKNYNHERFDPANPDKLKSVAQFKKEQAEAARVMAEAEARRERLRAEAAEEDARRARMHYSSTPAPTTTVVNNGSSSGDLAMGMMLGSMMSNNGHHHDTTRVIERETVREVPAKRDSSWDDTPSTPSRSSSWDDSSSKSSSRSSSWDDDSSSRSSSSWSSSSSDSSSSWSSSDSGSSSSWD